MAPANLLLARPVNESIDAAVSRLVTCDYLNGRYRIGTPILTAAGSLVDVDVIPEPGGTFTVSDGGVVKFEADATLHSMRALRTVARQKADEHQARYIDDGLYLLNIRPDRLKGAIISMANLTREIMDEVLLRSTKARRDLARDMLFERLDRAFGGDSVSHDAEIIGQSTAVYQVDAVVKRGDDLTVFNLFTRDPTSVSSAFMKLSDLHRLEWSPRLVAVTRDPDRVGPKLQLITSVASVVRLDAGVSTFARAAA